MRAFEISIQVSTSGACETYIVFASSAVGALKKAYKAAEKDSRGWGDQLSLKHMHRLFGKVVH